MSSPLILTPDQLRNASRLSSPAYQPREFTLNEVMDGMASGLTEALARDFSELPTLHVYFQLREELLQLGFSAQLIAKLLPRIKIGVSEAFIKHERYNEVIRLMARMIVKFYEVVSKKFTDKGEAEELFLAMTADRFSIVVPVS